MEDAKIAHKNKLELEERKAALKKEYSELRQIQELDKIAARGDVQADLVALRSKYRITRPGGLSVSDRELLYMRKTYEQYKLLQIANGKPYVSFEKYIQDDPEIIIEKEAGSGKDTRESGDAQQDFSGYKRDGSNKNVASAEDFSKYKRK